MADKKLAKKLAKMSEEERAAYLEKQKLLEEENQRRKEEMLSRFLKDKLVKEEKASKLNMLKIQNQWRDIMRKSKHLFCILWSATSATGERTDIINCNAPSSN